MPGAPDCPVLTGAAHAVTCAQLRPRLRQLHARAGSRASDWVTSQQSAQLLASLRAALRCPSCCGPAWRRLQRAATLEASRLPPLSGRDRVHVKPRLLRALTERDMHPSSASSRPAPIFTGGSGGGATADHLICTPPGLRPPDMHATNRQPGWMPATESTRAALVIAQVAASVRCRPCMRSAETSAQA